MITRTGRKNFNMAKLQNFASDDSNHPQQSRKHWLPVVGRPSEFIKAKMAARAISPAIDSVVIGYWRKVSRLL